MQRKLLPYQENMIRELCGGCVDIEDMKTKLDEEEIEKKYGEKWKTNIPPEICDYYFYHGYVEALSKMAFEKKFKNKMRIPCECEDVFLQEILREMYEPLKRSLHHYLNCQNEKEAITASCCTDSR